MNSSRWLAIVLAILACAPVAASQHAGQVTFGGVAVPGATITATQGEKTSVTVTDQQGVFRFADLADGMWTIRVDMLGFSKLTQEVSVSADAPPSMWELKLLPFDEIAQHAVRPDPEVVTANTTAPSTALNGSSRNSTAPGRSAQPQGTAQTGRPSEPAG